MGMLPAAHCPARLCGPQEQALPRVCKLQVKGEALHPQAPIPMLFTHCTPTRLQDDEQGGYPGLAGGIARTYLSLKWSWMS